MKKIVVSLSTSSFVSWLQVWKQMHSWLWLPISTSWRWKETQREFEKKKVLHHQLPFWKKKTSKVVYLKTQIQWRIGIERFGGTQLKFSGCTWYIIEFGKSKGDLEALSKKVNLMSEILARPVWEETPEETSRQADCTYKVAWNLAGKDASSKPKTTTFYYLVKAPETQKIVCLLCLRELQCTMLSEENWAQIQWILREGPRTPCETHTVQINE